MGKKRLIIIIRIHEFDVDDEEAQSKDKCQRTIKISKGRNDIFPSG